MQEGEMVLALLVGGEVAGPKVGIQRLAAYNCALTRQQRFRERFSARQLGLACAWRCRAQEHRLEHAPLHREF
jgi:hypothetical protein